MKKALALGVGTAVVAGGIFLGSSSVGATTATGSCYTKDYPAKVVQVKASTYTNSHGTVVHRKAHVLHRKHRRVTTCYLP